VATLALENGSCDVTCGTPASVFSLLSCMS
jgi:hypothetical protein